MRAITSAHTICQAAESSSARNSRVPGDHDNVDVVDAAAGHDHRQIDQGHCRRGPDIGCRVDQWLWGSRVPAQPRTTGCRLAFGFHGGGSTAGGSCQGVVGRRQVDGRGLLAARCAAHPFEAVTDWQIAQAQVKYGLVATIGDVVVVPSVPTGGGSPTPLSLRLLNSKTGKVVADRQLPGVWFEGICARTVAGKPVVEVRYTEPAPGGTVNVLFDGTGQQIWTSHGKSFGGPQATGVGAWPPAACSPADTSCGTWAPSPH